MIEITVTDHATGETTTFHTERAVVVSRAGDEMMVHAVGDDEGETCNEMLAEAHDHVHAMTADRPPLN